MSKHTPGPWLLEGPDAFGDFNVFPPESFATAGVMAEKILVPTNMRPADEVAANARLIAAAPELLEALEQAAIELEEASAILHGEGLTSTASLFTSAIARHRAAIAKAKGEG